MDWSNEIKILNKALKQYEIDKNKLEVNITAGFNNDNNHLKYLILQKELLIQNIESRIEIAKKKQLDECKKL